MELYSHTFEMRIRDVTLYVVAIRAEIIADPWTDGEWTVGRIEAAGLRDTVNGYGEDDFEDAWVEVPENHGFYDVLLRDLLDKCSDDIDEQWALYMMDAADTARCNAAERKLDAANAGVL